MEVELFSPIAIAVSQGHHSHFKLPVLQGWMKEWIQVMNGANGVELSNGQECGLYKGVDYLQEEMTVNRNALTYLPIH